MEKLRPGALWSLARYAEERDAFRARVMAHKASRRVSLGPHATLFFEDRLTMRYQVQEMLRAERIVDADEIQAELDAYNPLIPDGRDWKATLMIGYQDVAERRRALARMTGIEHRVWVGIEGFEPIFGVANEDMERSNDEKTSAVHFLRFPFPPAAITALRAGASLTLGIDHPALRCQVVVDDGVRAALTEDFD